MIRISNSKHRINQKVIIVKSHKDGYAHIIGQYGYVRAIMPCGISVQIPDVNNPRSAKGVFWFRASELKDANEYDLRKENDNMSKDRLTGYNRIAVINQNGRDYMYACYDDDINTDDSVIVTGRAGNEIWKVNNLIVKTNPEFNDIKPSEEIICKIDTTAYETRVKNREKAKQIRIEMAQKRKEIEARKDDEYYASLDPDYAEMLNELKNLNM